jgi:hypothetical protein
MNKLDPASAGWLEHRGFGGLEEPVRNIASSLLIAKAERSKTSRSNIQPELEEVPRIAEILWLDSFCDRDQPMAEWRMA